MYYRTYTCISDPTCIIRNLYWSYGIYICVRDLFLPYRSYTCVTELILVFRILFFCEGTCRYDKSERIRIVSHTRSYQTYIDTYQIWTFVFRRYRSQIHYTKVPIGTTRLILILQDLYLFYRYKSTRRYYQTYTYFTDTRVPLGTTGLILVRISRRSYRVSSYSGLILIAGLLSFGTPVGVTELILPYP